MAIKCHYCYTETIIPEETDVEVWEGDNPEKDMAKQLRSTNGLKLCISFMVL